jgi:FKBP-type peptidyl-prolyl cis-trans isomerase FklB
MSGMEMRRAMEQGWRGGGMQAAILTLAVWAAAGRAASGQPPPASLPAAARPAAAGPRLDTPAAELGYALGLRIGSRIAADFKGQEPPVEPAALARGLTDAILEIRPQLADERIRGILEAFDASMRQRQEAFGKRMAEAAKVNQAKAVEFARANAAKKGVVSLPSGLQYEVLREGTGTSPKAGDTVAAHYRGTRLDGSEFDATDPKEDPAVFPLTDVVAGWQEALVLMKPGAKWRVFVPPQLGYGEQGSPPVIEPNELLIFEIELVNVLPPQ